MVIRDLGGRGISVQDATWYTEKNGRHGGHMVILGRGIVNYIIIVIVGVVIGALLRSSRKHDAQAVDKHEVRENPLLLVLAFPVLVICAVLAWGLDSQSAGIGWTVVVAIFSLLPLSMALAVVNRRITYDDEGFTTRDLVRCSRRFSYCDITGTLAGSDSVTYHMGTHRFRIDDNMVGGIGFKAAASSWARRNGRVIPQLKSPLFGGNVINPGNLVFIYGVWVVCAVGFFSLSYVFGGPDGSPDHRSGNLPLCGHRLRGHRYLPALPLGALPHTSAAILLLQVDDHRRDERRAFARDATHVWTEAPRRSARKTLTPTPSLADRPSRS